MSRIKKAVATLEKTLELLLPYSDVELCTPEAGKFYKTINGSIVHVLGVDDDGDADCVVLRGGHGLAEKRGEEPGERFMLTADGCYAGSDSGPELVLSIVELLSLQLPPDNNEDIGLEE
jgi:hypothetical protein